MMHSVHSNVQSFANMSPEIGHYIMGYLPYCEASKVATVCRAWYEIVQNCPQLWLPLIELGERFTAEIADLTLYQRAHLAMDVFKTTHNFHRQPKGEIVDTPQHAEIDRKGCASHCKFTDNSIEISREIHDPKLVRQLGDNTIFEEVFKVTGLMPPQIKSIKLDSRVIAATVQGNILIAAVQSSCDGKVIDIMKRTVLIKMFDLNQDDLSKGGLWFSGIGIIIDEIDIDADADSIHEETYDCKFLWKAGDLYLALKATIKNTTHSYEKVFYQCYKFHTMPSLINDLAEPTLKQ